MKQVLWIAMVFLLVNMSYGFFSDKVQSGSYAGTGGAGAATGLQRLGLGQNPAVLSPLHQGLQLDYGHPYGLEGVTELGAAYFRDAKKIGFALEYWQLSWDQIYQEKTYELQVGFKLPWNIALGLNGNIRKVEILARDQDLAWASGEGIIWKPTDKISFGGYIRNELASSQEFSPLYELGLAIRDIGLQRTGFSPKQSLFVDWRHSENNEGQFIFGHELEFFSCLKFHTGIREKPFQFLFGISVQFHDYHIQQALIYHPDLGLSQHSGFAWESLHP
jgi:hypothetical protein